MRCSLLWVFTVQKRGGLGQAFILIRALDNTDKTREHCTK